MSKPVRISDVAEAAGVSITTVSHALNDKGRLTDETRRRVREVADRLGYQPSALARGLAGGRSGMLAVTVSFVEDMTLAVADFDYFIQVMNAAASAALERGFSLTLVPADSRQLLDRLPLDGAIVMDPVPGDEIVDQLDRRGVPVVTTGRRPDGPDETCWVDNDHVAGTREMLDHLLDEGATRLALLTVPVRSSYTVDALAAFEGVCAERGIEPIVETITDSISEGGAYAAASRLLESKDPPDAIYATLDRLALGALLAAEAKGVRVPEELRIAGCTDSDASRAARPALTALSLNPEQIGLEALDLLVTLVEDGEPAEPHRIVPFVVVPRGSTKAGGRARSPARDGSVPSRARASRAAPAAPGGRTPTGA
jgi:DNA-binding LacI/PurR family transcriptional regulator